MQYVKMFIMSFIAGVFEPLASSSSAHFAFLNKILNFSDDSNEINFYLSIVSIVFSLVALFFVRKIYAKGFQSVFSKKKSTLRNASAYRSMMIGVLISLIPAVLVCVPVSKTNFIFDMFDDYLTGSRMLVTAFCCTMSGVILLIALWYARNKNVQTHRSCSKSDVLRMSLYQIPAFIFPGFSHICVSTASMETSGVDDKTIMREIFIFLAPSTFIVNAIRVVRCIMNGLSFNVILTVVCVVAALVSSMIVFNLVSKINIRRSFAFFSIYSIIFGLCIAATAFI